MLNLPDHPAVYRKKRWQHFCGREEKIHVLFFVATVQDYLNDN
jgi:hypothetical protein